MTKNSLSLALAFAVFGAAGMAQAVTLDMNPLVSSPAPGATVTGVALSASSTAGARGWNATFSVPTGLTLTNVTANAGVLGAFGSCSFDGVTSRLIVLAGNLNTDLTAGSACTFNIVVGGGVADASVLAIEPVGTPGCTTTTGMGTCTTTVTDASAGDPGNPGIVEAHVVTVTNTPVPLTLSYSPVAGSTISFAPGGLIGEDAADATISATAAGNSGSATLSGCAISGSGASAFSVTPASLTFNGAGSQDLTVGCTYQAAAATGTLTCSETDGNSSAVARQWPLSCSAGGVPNIVPTITTSTGATVTTSQGQAGAVSSGTIDFSNVNGSGSSSATIECSSNDERVSVNPASQTVTGATAPTDVTVSIDLIPTTQTIADAVTCDITDLNGLRSQNFAVSAPAGSVFIPPNVIPSASTWSKIALFGLLGLFGVMAVGFRRQG